MTRERILSAAGEVLDHEGIGGLTIRKVAARAGLSPMAIYRHFDDKDALINALMADGLAVWGEIARSVRDEDPVRWLWALMDAYLDFALTQPHRFDAAFFLPARDARKYPDDFLAGRSPIISMIMVRIDQATAGRRPSGTTVLDITLVLVALAQGLISMQRANRFSSVEQFKALYRATLRLSIDSLSIGPATSTAGE